MPDRSSAPPDRYETIGLADHVEDGCRARGRDASRQAGFLPPRCHSRAAPLGSCAMSHEFPACRSTGGGSDAAGSIGRRSSGSPNAGDPGDEQGASAAFGGTARSRHGEVHRPHRPRRTARPRERRHRRDHPEAVPEVDQAHRLRPAPVRRMALPGYRRAGHGPHEAPAEPGLRPEPADLQGGDDPPRAQELRLRLLARARSVGPAAVRVQGRHRAFVRRHLLQQQLQERLPPDRAARFPDRPPLPGVGCASGVQAHHRPARPDRGHALEREADAISTSTPRASRIRSSTAGTRSASRCATRTRSRRTKRSANAPSPGSSRSR